MGKILCFVPENCADFEAVLALHLLNGEKGLQVRTVGFSRGPVAVMSGLTLAADYTLEEAAELKDVRALIMPGGPLKERDGRLVDFIVPLHKRGALLAAICFAPQYLARCGLLDTHRYTTSCTPEHVRKAGIPDPFPRENYVNERVVIDGNIITAQGHAFVDFAFAIAEYLGAAAGQEDEYEGFRRNIKAL